MKHCISCGGEITDKPKFCPSCGAHLKSGTKQQESSIKKYIIIISFVIAVGFIIFSQSKDDYSGDNADILPKTLSEKIINTEKPYESKQSEPKIKKEGYNLNEKPFDDRNYVYDKRTKDFRLVCSNPCPVSESILNQEFAAVTYAISTLRGLTQSNLDSNIAPFEVHASEDDICPLNPEAAAYMTTFTDGKAYQRGLLCFFYDKVQYDRSRFPYSTSVHEVTHLFEYGKIKHNSIIWEGLSEMMESFFLKGNELNSFCWKGNAWFKEAMKNVDDPHWIGGNLFFELCDQYGFDYQHLPSLFAQLDAKGPVDEYEFVQIINKIVGADTSDIFSDAGVI